MEQHLDVAEAMRTVAVNSAYHASRALSKWFKHGIRVTSDGFESIPIRDVGRLMGDCETTVAAILLPLMGDIEGDILLAFPDHVALRLANSMMGADPEPTGEFDELRISCLQETGNIVASAFANSFASWLGLSVVPGAPVFVLDLAGAVIQSLVISHAAEFDEVIVSRTDFEWDGSRIDWRFVFLPSPAARRQIEKRCRQDDIQRRALSTIAVNAAFDASRAMSKWIRRGVRLTTDGFQMMPLRSIRFNHDEDQPVVALHSVIGEDLDGQTLAVMSLPTALELVDILLGQAPGTSQAPLDDMGASCMQETCNILSTAFVSSWARCLGVTAESRSPRVLVDYPQALLENVLLEQAKVADEVLFCKTEFSVDGRRLGWEFVLVPAFSSLCKIESACS